MSPKKIIFFAILGVVVLAIAIGLSLLSKKQEVSNGVGPGDLSVWVVGDDSVGFADIVSGFKTNPTYKNTNVLVTKFASYADYERSLLNVIADGNSPDVFVVPSTGADILESKIEPIPDSVLNMDDISKNLNKLFDPLIKIEPGKSEDGKDIQIRSMKGVPLGYETIGVFYNRALVENAVPATWDEFRTSIENADSTLGVPAALGLGGKYITQAPSIFSAFLVQYGITSVDKLQEAQAQRALEDYLSYAGSLDEANSTNQNNLVSLRATMDREKLTTTDLFVRGEIGVIFGFPSILREIEYSIKRASSDAELQKRDLRSTNIPQGVVWKKTNLARYNYFAVSKYSPNIVAAADFVAYLSTKEAGEAYMRAFPSYLPARNDIIESLGDMVMNKSFPWVRYESFLPANDIELITFDRWLTSEFETFVGRQLDEAVSNPKATLLAIQQQVACRKRQLIEGSGFEEACEP